MHKKLMCVVLIVMCGQKCGAEIETVISLVKGNKKIVLIYENMSSGGLGTSIEKKAVEELQDAVNYLSKLQTPTSFFIQDPTRHIPDTRGYRGLEPFSLMANAMKNAKSNVQQGVMKYIFYDRLPSDDFKWFLFARQYVLFTESLSERVLGEIDKIFWNQKVSTLFRSTY